MSTSSRPDPEDPADVPRGADADQPVFQLMRRVLQEHTAAWQARVPHLTKPQYAVLHAIAAQPGIDQASVGQIAAIDKATLATLLLRLEERGLIVRTVDVADRRRRLLELTDQGRAQLREAVRVANSVDPALLSRLTRAERDELRRLLAKLAER
jgi:DNA-binding MarR family transcriptional regulator